MKTISNYLSVLAMAGMGLLVAGCQSEKFPVPADEADLIPLNIDGAISQVHTKATSAGFVDKDALGLYAVNYTDNNTVAGTLEDSGNQADNVKYVFDEANHKWNPVKPVYYKDINTNVDIYVYYPFQASVSDVNNANFEVRKDQSAAATTTSLSGYEASDYLWGKSAQVQPTQGKVSIKLYHRMSAVSLTLTEGSGFGDGEFEGASKSVILTNTTRKARIDYATGEVTPLGEPQADGIVMSPQNDGKFRAVVVPQDLGGGKQMLAITINGDAKAYVPAEAVSFVAGKQLNVNLTVSKSVPGGDYTFTLTSAEITDWTEDKNTHGGEARQYYVVNVGTAGTLGKLIKDAGKNPNKIKNIKITGNIKNNDFYFMRDSMAILEAVNLKESRLENDEVPGGAFQDKKTLISIVLPDEVKVIGEYAFMNTLINGNMTFPNELKTIGLSSFNNCKNLSSIVFSAKLERIEERAFYNCMSLSGSLDLPNSLTYIGNFAFSCDNFSSSLPGIQFTGQLHLPDNLEYIGISAFYGTSGFTGDLVIPEKITSIYPHTFRCSGFTGTLTLPGNLEYIGERAFEECGFIGELVIPERVLEIEDGAFKHTKFSSLFLNNVQSVGNETFYHNSRLSSVNFGKSVALGQRSFCNCSQIKGLVIPESVQTISVGAFAGCSQISSIICNAIEPPTVGAGAFDGVAKNNFTVEVPANKVKVYQSEPGWSDFNRIAAHYDFSISSSRLRTLNGELERIYTLRAPSGLDWVVTSKPEWVTVTPMSGTGKTDVTVTVSEMARTDEKFEVNEGTYNEPVYKQYKGRADMLVFTLSDKNYTCSMDIEQYDYDYADGSVRTYNTATTGPGIDIVFIGDGYDAKDIAKGTFLDNAEDGYDHLFDVEPYKSYKEYFNVKAVISMSDESGIGTVNTVVNTKFGSYMSQNRILCPAPEPCFAWAMTANPSMDLTKSLTIMLMNTSTYEGVTMMYGDGSVIALCPVSTDAYPYDFRGLIQHEAGGHGFGKLGDEYIYHNAFIQNCICTDGCDHPANDEDKSTGYGRFKSLGWYKNLSMKADPKLVPWAHLIYNSKYSDYVDMYEGGYMHTRGVYRSEATSCMNNNIPYYSAISRQAIVERIKYCAGEQFDLDEFYLKDKDTFGTKSSLVVDRTFGIDPKWNRGSEEGSVVYMGEHPDYSKIR